MSIQVKQLLLEPLGNPAYWYDDILTPECKSVGKKVLTLSNVMLSCGGKPTGLTYCEFTQPEYKGDFIKRNCVLLRGVLVIRKLNWLTEEGRRALNKELRKRDNKARHVAGSDNAPSDLTVGKVLGLKRDLKVWIQIDKPYKYPAQYMLYNKFSDGLCLWIDPERGKYFRVDSMDSETSDRSQLFFARYRIAHDMDQLVKEAEKQNLDSIHLGARTPEWFIEQYMRLRYQGLVGDQYNEVEKEVRALFLAHCEWLIQDQHRQKTHRLFDTKAWEEWLAKQGRQRDDEDLQDFSDSDRMVVDEASEEDRMEEDDIPVRQRRRTTGQSSRRNNTAPQQRVGRKRPLSPEVSRPPTPDANDGVPGDEESSGLEYIDDPGQLVEPDYYRLSSDDSDSENYVVDEDFSPEESPPKSDSDSDDVPRSRVPTEPAVMAAIPYVLQRAPRIPHPGMPWYCPVRGCNHEINMYDLSRDHPTIYALSKQKRDWIRSGGWSWQDPDAVECFEMLVSAHYDDHLNELGIELVGDRSDRVARWKHPAEHPPKHGKIIAKEEKWASTQRNTVFNVKPEPSQ